MRTRFAVLAVAALAAAMAIFTSSAADAQEMRVVLARDLSWVRAVPASTLADTEIAEISEFINLEMSKKLEMTDGLAVYEGDPDENFSGFVTDERLAELVTYDVNLRVRDTWNRVLLEKTDGLFFVALSVNNGKKDGIAIPVNFPEPRTDVATPSDQHTGGHFSLMPVEWPWVPWQEWQKQQVEEPTSDPYHLHRPEIRAGE